MTSVTQLSPGLWQISLPFQGEPDIVGSYLLARNDEIAIIDPGPSSTLEALLAAIHEAGFDPRSVTHILATHIHLDHTGAAGSLLHHMPRATVYVHRIGAPHLLDTSKVTASATRIYGERMQTLWGTIEPVPQERLHILEDDHILTIAGRQLRVYYTPGHAVHHIVYVDVHSREIFTGDVAGVRLQGVDYIRPPTPPPDLDLEDWFHSIDMLRQLHPDVLYIAHFGPVRDPIQHLERLQEKLTLWGEFVLAAMQDGRTESEIIEALIAHTQPELQNISSNPHVLTRYEIATNYLMTVQGYMRYWKKKHPERL